MAIMAVARADAAIVTRWYVYPGLQVSGIWDYGWHFDETRRRSALATTTSPMMPERPSGSRQRFRKLRSTGFAGSSSTLAATISTS